MARNLTDKQQRFLEVLFEEAKGDTESIAGFVLELMGKFPEKGDEVKFENYNFIVESVLKRRVNRIKVKIDA